MEEKELLTADAAAAKLYITRRTILKWARDGKIESFKVSRKMVLFTAEAIDKLLQKKAVVLKSEATNHQRAGRKMGSPQKTKGGGKKTSGESWSNLRKEVMQWQ